MRPRRIRQMARQPLRPGSPLTCRPSLVIAMSLLAIGCLPTTLVRGQLVPRSQWERISHAQWTFAQGRIGRYPKARGLAAMAVATTVVDIGIIEGAESSLRRHQ